MLLNFPRITLAEFEDVVLGLPCVSAPTGHPVSIAAESVSAMAGSFGGPNVYMTLQRPKTGVAHDRARRRRPTRR